MHARLYSCICIWKGEAHLIVMRIVEVQADDLRRFDKHKKRATLWTGEYLPVMNCTFFAVQKALKYGWVSIPYHLMLYTNGVAEQLYWIESDLITSLEFIFVDKEHVQ